MVADRSDWDDNITIVCCFNNNHLFGRDDENYLSMVAISIIGISRYIGPFYVRFMMLLSTIDPPMMSGEGVFFFIFIMEDIGGRCR